MLLYSTRPHSNISLLKPTGLPVEQYDNINTSRVFSFAELYRSIDLRKINTGRRCPLEQKQRYATRVCSSGTESRSGSLTVSRKKKNPDSEGPTFDLTHKGTAQGNEAIGLRRHYAALSVCAVSRSLDRLS